MRRLVGILGFVGFVAAAFVLTLVPGGVWAALLSVNLKTGAMVPWAVPVALGLLWLAWRFAGGERPGPRSEARRALRRANAMAPKAFLWALLANGFSLTALSAVWILLHEVVKTHGNPLPDFSIYPLPLVVLVLGCAAIVGAVSEEVGLRGYLQTRLEGLAPWPVAVALMALVASSGHALTQGFVWPTLLFYFLADVTYGVTAYLTNSILPGVVAHAAGLFVFFAVIWPHDAARAEAFAGFDAAFWGLVAQAAVFGGLTVWAFLQLARTTVGKRRTQPLRGHALSAAVA
jgi:membrane protease YdiL (CAAX protease family)